MLDYLRSSQIVWIRQLFVTASDKFTLKRAGYRIIPEVYNIWIVDFFMEHWFLHLHKKTTQHKIMTTNMRFNTWIINLWQLVIDYSKYITNLISQKSSTRFTINCLLIQSKSKAMWFLWSLSWISMLLQICFVTLAIGKLSNPNFRFGPD